MALDLCKVACFLQLHPVGLVDLRADEEPKVVDLSILANEGCSQPKLAMSLQLIKRLLELSSWQHMHLVEYHQPKLVIPFQLAQHDLARLRALALAPSGQRAVSGDNHVRPHHCTYLIFALFTQRCRRESFNANSGAEAVGPILKLELPLVHTEACRTQNHRLLIDGACGSYSNKRLSGATGQYDQA